MEKNDIIDQVDEPSDWVHSMVIVEKRDGKLQICLGPHDLKKGNKKRTLPNEKRWIDYGRHGWRQVGIRRSKWMTKARSF